MYKAKYHKYKAKYLDLKGGIDKYIYVNDPWFTLIKEGKKVVEGRPNKNIFAQLQVGDTVIWKNKNDSFRTCITKIAKYNTFAEMLEKEGLANVLPGVPDIASGVAVYRQWYDSRVEQQFGVLGIHLDKN